MLGKLTVLYKEAKGKVKTEPTQGYEDDFGYDIYTAEGRLVPPLTFKSVIIPTTLTTAFDPKQAGLKVTLRSGIANNTPLVITNAPGIVEGDYRKAIGVLVRNTFIDNSLVGFALDEKGNKIPLKDIPKDVLNKARKQFEEERTLIGYTEPMPKELGEAIFKTAVPRGTVYIKKGTRLAQIHFSPKIDAEFVASKELPDSVRGEKGFGSSGTN